MFSGEIIIPSVALQPFVHHYWILKTCQTSMSQLIMPMACLKWMFHRKRPFEIDGKAEDSMKATIVGIYDKAIQIHSDEDIELIIVFFKPYAAKAILNIPCQEFARQNIDLDDIGNIEFHDLKNRILDAATSEECIGIIEDFILRQLIKNEDNVYMKPLAKVFAQMNANPEARIEELAGVACLSERQFRRVFTDHVGMRPKQIQRLQRFQQATKELLSAEGENLEPLLCKYGYTDHSHFNHEFHEIARISPTQYIEMLKQTRKEGTIKAYRSYYNPE
ncbi:MAG: helix-turn-helix transcriptional regulator [Bacteroidales bacterium]|nr:helix-turn-helix transcriptional regulator [Bacteroidales bacterium]